MPRSDTSLPARLERALPKLANGFPPIAAIEFELFYFLFRKVEVIKTAHVYLINIGSGARPCESVDPADRTRVVRVAKL